MAEWSIASVLKTEDLKGSRGSNPFPSAMGIKKITIEFDEDWQAPYNLTEPKSNDPCEFCNNNPKNNPYASGICNCALPYFVGKNIIY